LAIEWFDIKREKKTSKKGVVGKGGIPERKCPNGVLRDALMNITARESGGGGEKGEGPRKGVRKAPVRSASAREESIFRGDLGTKRKRERRVSTPKFKRDERPN